MTCDIVISIINYCTEDMTRDCVVSVQEALKEHPSAHIVIVDNLSPDDSAKALKEWIDQTPMPVPVTFVQSDTNSGFSGGHNQGMAAVDGRYYLILNSDAVVRPDFFDEILAVADANPKAGLIAPKIIYDDGEVQDSSFRFASPGSELIASANSGPVTKLLKRYDISLGPDPKEEDIDWVSFACVLLRKEMVAEIGPMDEGYFLYFEDAEYCLRAKRAGWGVKRAPLAKLVHFRGGSGPVKSLQKAKKRLPKYYYSSRTRFLYQAHGWLGLWSANLLWYLGRVLANARRLAGKQVPQVATSQGKDLWVNATNPLGPRYAPWEGEGA